MSIDFACAVALFDGAGQDAGPEFAACFDHSSYIYVLHQTKSDRASTSLRDYTGT